MRSCTGTPTIVRELAKLLDAERFGGVLKEYRRLAAQQTSAEEVADSMGLLEAYTPEQLLAMAERNLYREGLVTPDPQSDEARHLVAMDARHSVKARTVGERHDWLMANDAGYRAVYERFHRPDGSSLPGWLKAPNGRPTKLDPVQYVQVRTPAFKAWFGDWENAYYTKGWFDVRDAEEFLKMHAVEMGAIRPISDKDGIKSLFRDFGDVTNANDGRVVRFPAEMAGKTVFLRNFASAFKVLFEGSKRAWSEKETLFEGHKSHPNIDAFHHYINKFCTADGDFFVRFTVREGRDTASEGRNLVHAANVTNVEVYKSGTTQTEKSDRSEVPNSTRTTKTARIDYKIAHFLNRVNAASVSKQG